VISRLFPLLALAALILGIVALSGGEREPAPAAPVLGPPHDPGYSALNARLIQTGADGAPAYTLDAAQVQQQPNQGIVSMQQVQLGFRDDTGNHWTARSRTGELGQNTGVVQLDGDVHVLGAVPGTQDAMEIISERLAFDTHSQMVTTPDPVTILMTGRKLDATGLSASLKERVVQLESNVHGTFLP
jgi:LPS export ABC transporter protein LptC